MMVCKAIAYNFILFYFIFGRGRHLIVCDLLKQNGCESPGPLPELSLLYFYSGDLQNKLLIHKCEMML